MDFPNHPTLKELPGLVKQQRRLLAGSLRIVREEKALREKIARLLEDAGVEQLTCEGFNVFRVERDGRTYAIVNPIRESPTTT